MSKAPPKLEKPGDWQRFCTGLLRETLVLPEHQRAQGWRDARALLLRIAARDIADPNHRRIIIADADLRDQNLEDFDFSHCYIVRSSFRGANLKNSKFRFSIIRSGTINDANANGASFEHADIEGASLETMQYNSETNLNFARFKPAGDVPTALQNRVNKDRIAASTRDGPVLTKVLNAVSGYGFGIGRLVLVCCGIVVTFGIIYRFAGPERFAVGAGSAHSDSLTLWNYVLLSAERFLNASPWIYGVSPLTHFLTVIETIFGLIMLAILVAMLVRQAVRSPD